MRAVSTCGGSSQIASCLDCATGGMSFELKGRTLHFFALRRAVEWKGAADSDVPAPPTPDGFDGCLDALHGLRAQAIGLVRDDEGSRWASDAAQRQFEALVWAVWRTVSKHVSEERAGALPAPYDTVDVKASVTWLSQQLLNLECRRRPAAARNVIYEGHRGCGKTLMLRVAGTVAAVLLQHTLPIFWDFECDSVSGSHPTIHELMTSAACAWLGRPLSSWPPVDSAIGDVADAMAREGLVPLLLLDEFTALYVTRGGSDVAHGAHVMRVLHSLCKIHANVLALLAASKTDVSHYIHRSETPEDAYALYPDLNNQVFVPCAVKPIRDAAFLKTYVEARYPGWRPVCGPDGELGEVDGAAVLRATGGIGRVVDEYVRARGALDSSTHTVNIDAVSVSPVLFGIFLLFASSEGGVVSFQDAVAMAATCLGTTVTRAALHIVQWCDAGAFYRHDLFLEVLIPSVLHDFVAKIAESRDLNRLRVLLVTMHGFEGGSVGRSNKSLVCKYIHEHPDVNVARSEERVLSLGGSSASLDGTPASLDELLDCVMPWKVGSSETAGLDRIWLVKRRDDAAGAAAGGAGSAGRAVVEVCGLQIKTGRANKRMTAGMLATQRLLSTQSVDDTTIAGVLVNAERGLSKLVLALRTCFVDVDFTLGRVILFTTKRLGDDRDALDKFVEKHPAHTAKLQLHTGTEPQADKDVTALVASGLSEFEWAVHDGDDWLRRIFPAAYARMLPPSTE